MVDRQGERECVCGHDERWHSGLDSACFHGWVVDEGCSCPRFRPVRWWHRLWRWVLRR